MPKCIHLLRPYLVGALPPSGSSALVRLMKPSNSPPLLVSATVAARLQNVTASYFRTGNQRYCENRTLAEWKQETEFIDSLLGSELVLLFYFSVFTSLDFF